MHKVITKLRDAGNYSQKHSTAEIRWPTKRIWGLSCVNDKELSLMPGYIDSDMLNIAFVAFIQICIHQLLYFILKLHKTYA